MVLMESNDWIAFGLAGLAGFLLFLGGWSIFMTLAVASDLGFSTGLMFQGVPALSIGVSVGIFIGGIVCAYLAYRFSSVERWGTVQAVMALILVGLLVLQVVYAYEGGGDGGNLPPSDDGVPLKPELSGWFKVYEGTPQTGRIELSGNVPFDIWFNRINLGQGATFGIDADLSLKNVQQSPPVSASFTFTVMYSPMTSSGWGPYVRENVPVQSASPVWVSKGGGKYSASIRDLQFLTLTARSPEFLNAYDGRCRFKISASASTTADGVLISTGTSVVEFELKSTMGSLRIEGVSGWAE